MLARVLGVIPARHGSKRIPRKNLRTINGKPLIAYTIEAAKRANSLTDWLVTTDDATIGAVAEIHGAKVHLRSEMDDSHTSAQACIAALDAVGRYGFDLVALLHPTSPIRNALHIDQAVEMLWASDAPALASVECRKRTYTHNASIYVMRTEWLLKTKQHYSEESIPFLMDQRHSVDIDTEDDFRIAELWLQD